MSTCVCMCVHVMCVRMQVSFLLPPGVGTSRALRVLVYPSYRVELASVSNPLQVRARAPGLDIASEL
jgi:hypothetical protein